MNQLTPLNYFEKTKHIDFSNLPEPLQKGHELVRMASSNGSDWSAYSGSETTRRVTNKYFEKLQEYMASHKNTLTPPPPKPKSRTKVKISVTQAKPKRQPKIKTAAANVKKSEHLLDEVKFIKRYVALHNKTKSPNAILNFIKALQRAIVQKLVTKKSPFAAEIRLIQEKLIELYDKMKGDMSVQINEKDLARMVGIAGGEAVYYSVGIMKRFIGLQGKALETKKRENFIRYIENALKKDRFENDPYADKVKSILKILQKGSKTVQITQTELNGLQGIVKNCRCKSLGRIYRTGGKKLRPCKSKNYSDAGQGACSHHKGLSGVLTAEQIANRSFQMLPFTGRWFSLIGQPAKNFRMMLHGEPGAGKTTFLLQFIKYLSSLGSVLYVSSEEFESVTLTDKVREYLTPRPANVHFASDIKNINLGLYDVVVLDSVNDLGLSLEDFKVLKEKYPDTAFILILQHTKDGQFKGGKEWEHEAQIVGRVDNGVIDIYKNRFGIRGTMNFFNTAWAA